MSEIPSGDAFFTPGNIDSDLFGTFPPRPASFLSGLWILRFGIDGDDDEEKSALWRRLRGVAPLRRPPTTDDTVHEDGSDLGTVAGPILPRAGHLGARPQRRRMAKQDTKRATPLERPSGGHFVVNSNT